MVLAALAAVLVASAASAVRGPSPELATPVPCSELAPDHGDGPLLAACAPAIRPGAASNVCTLNFVLTDGTELYIGAAGHCTFVGKRVRVHGVPGEIGTVVFRESGLRDGEGDWALVHIDPEDRDKVDPTMCRFAGPVDGPLGHDVRTPYPGESVLHYGHGRNTNTHEELHGRGGLVVPPVFSNTYVNFVGSASGGDSGSPVRLATGEAAGIVIAVAGLEVGDDPVLLPLVFAARFDLALRAFESAIGEELTLVSGEGLVV